MTGAASRTIDSVEALEEALSAPDSAVVEAMGNLQGDLILLGAGGKMGPTLARMAKRACDGAGVPRRVIAVSRFSNRSARDGLNQHGIETVSCDLLDETQVAQLPDAANVLFMTGMKFGTADNPSLTWAMNTHAPALVCTRFRGSTIVAFSTGNVYGMTAVAGGGSREGDRLAPDGEYAMSALGRERAFEYFSRAQEMPTSIVRLNYACELRYGVLVDIANWVWNEKSVPLGTGHVNVIWQRDANAFTLRAFEHAGVPPFITNVAGPETVRVRDIAEGFGARMNKSVEFDGVECDTAYLSDAQAMRETFGPPSASLDHMLDWVADWVMRGGEQLGKPTHFEVRSGSF